MTDAPTTTLPHFGATLVVTLRDGQVLRCPPDPNKPDGWTVPPGTWDFAYAQYRTEYPSEPTPIMTFSLGFATGEEP